MVMGNKCLKIIMMIDNLLRHAMWIHVYIFVFACKDGTMVSIN